MASLNPSDIVLTGIPRGGTTLACRLLGEAADTLALFEPMPVAELPITADAAAAEVARYFSQVRQRALSEGRVLSKHRDGRVPDNPYGERASAGELRPWLVEQGDIAVGKPLSAEFRLVIKHNAAFTALLPALCQRFAVVGIVRNPLAVLASWRSVDLPVTQGRLPAGERLDSALAVALAAQPDCLRRQILILDWFFARLRRWVAPERLLRYEDVVASGGACLRQAIGLPVDTTADLRSRNENAQYDRASIDELVRGLRRYAGASLDCYGAEAVDELAARMAAQGAGDD
jgi:hypothetical protein